ncbi:MAG: hypothetical protein ACK4GM_05125 [Tabrizicola sp.]
MFLHSRFVVVDDKDEHLAGIKNALDQLRLDCHTKLYDVENVAAWSKLPGTRILFMDKNLRPGVTMGGGVQDSFAAIAEVIQLLINPESGPYGLVLWAEEPQLEALKAFLYERLAVVDPRLLPVFFAELKKGNYIQVANGEVIDAERLRTDVVAALGQSPQMKALFSWESDVMAASDAVLRSMVDLVPPNKRASDSFGDELGKALYRLSQAGAGINRAMENPRESINRVLVPILADRITEHDPEATGHADWTAALVDPNEQSTLALQAAVNTAIHLSVVRSADPGSRPIRSADLGAVSEYPYDQSDEGLRKTLGLARKQLFGDLFKAEENEWADCQLRLVQIGAACDFAQPKPGPLTFLVGIEWRFANADGSKNDAKPSLWNGNSKKTGRSKPGTGSEWHSPVLEFPGAGNPGRLSVFRNLAVTVPPAAIEDWTVVYRLREELISELTQEYGRYISRPGIVTLPP